MLEVTERIEIDELISLNQQDETQDVDLSNLELLALSESFPKESTWKRRLIPLGTLLLFWGIYFSTGLLLTSTDAAAHYDSLFQADPPRVIRDLTSPEGDGGRTNVHPLFVLFFNPIGTLLSKITGSAISGALLITSFFGALCVVLSQCILVRLGMTASHSFLWSAVIGLSSSQIFFSSMPDTFIFGAGSLLLIYLAMIYRPSSLSRFMPAGIYVLGITTTNFIQYIFIYLFSLKDRNFRRKEILLRLTAVVAVVLVCAVGLSIAQRKFYSNSTRYFFLPGVYKSGVFEYVVSFKEPGKLLTRAGNLVEHFFAYNILAPRPYLPELQTHFDEAETPVPWTQCPPLCEKKRLIAPGTGPEVMHPPTITFDVTSIGAYRIPGLIGVLLWGALLVSGIYTIASRNLDWSPFLSALVFCISFNFLLHLIYGDDLFLYSAHWTFQIIIAVALTLRRYWSGKALKVALGVIISLQIVNTAMFFQDLLLIYSK